MNFLNHLTPRRVNRDARASPHDSIKTLWCRWTQVVEMFARRRPARRRVDPHAYRDLHRRLVLECRSLAGSPEEPRRDFYQGLEEIAAPWLSLRTLNHSDGEILGSLLARCRAVEQQLGHRRTSPALIRVAQAAVLVAAAAGAFLVLQTSGLDLQPLVSRVKDSTGTAWGLVERSTEAQRIAVVGVVMIFASIRLLSRPAAH